MGNGVHAWSMVRRRFPESVVIFGAGAIGLFTLQVAKAGGAGRVAVVDVSPARLAVATRLGAERVLNARTEDIPGGLSDFSRGRGAEVAIDAVGAASTRDLAVKAIRKGGECVWLGLHDDATTVGGLDIVLGEKAIWGLSRSVRGICTVPWTSWRPARFSWTPGSGPSRSPRVRRVFQQLVTAPPDDYIKAVLLP